MSVNLRREVLNSLGNTKLVIVIIEKFLILFAFETQSFQRAGPQLVAFDGSVVDPQRRSKRAKLRGAALKQANLGNFIGQTGSHQQQRFGDCVVAAACDGIRLGSTGMP